jgi:hypothetical protein
MRCALSLSLLAVCALGAAPAFQDEVRAAAAHHPSASQPAPAFAAGEDGQPPPPPPPDELAARRTLAVAAGAARGPPRFGYSGTDGVAAASAASFDAASGRLLHAAGDGSFAAVAGPADGAPLKACVARRRQLARRGRRSPGCASSGITFLSFRPFPTPRSWYVGALNPGGRELGPDEAAALEASFAEFKRANGLAGAADDARLPRDLSQSWAALAHLRDEAAPALAAARARARTAAASGGGGGGGSGS